MKLDKVTGRLAVLHNKLQSPLSMHLQHPSRVVALLLLALFAPQVALSQKLPPPSRTVYKCEVKGKVTYSDEPCAGAQRIDVEPTRGLNKSSGTERVGADVQREHRREALAEAVRPITGMDSKQFDQAGRRTRLTPAAQRSCTALDREIPALEEREVRASGEDRAAVQAQLFAARKNFRELRCQ